MAWIKVNGEKDRKEVWLVFGKEAEGYQTVATGEELTGYLERLSKSEKYNQAVVSLIGEDNVRYIFFCPASLERQLRRVLEEAGSGVAVKIIYRGLDTYQDKTYHKFDVFYDPERRLEEI